MTAHTPGPWRLVTHEDGTAVSIEPNVLWLDEDGYCSEATPGDLALMAAAPELLDALNDLMDVQNGPPLITYTEAWNAAMDKARAALTGSQR